MMTIMNPSSKELKAVFWILISITFISMVLTAVRSIQQSNSSGGTDLRARIVGARLMADKKSPYFYKWHREDGQYLLDPNIAPNRMVNGNVVTPAVLAVIQPISKLKYSTIRIIWTCLELLAAFLTVFLCVRGYGRTSLLLACFCLVGFLPTDLMLLHVDRGQMYVFYAAYFSIIYSIYISSSLKYRVELSGMLAGLFFYFRPFAGIICLPFLLVKNLKFFLGFIIGLSVGALLFVLPLFDNWIEYFRAMNIYIQETLGVPLTTNSIPDVYTGQKIEGMTNLATAPGFRFDSLNSLYYYVEQVGLHFSSAAYYAVFAVFVVSFSLIYLKFRSRTESDKTLFLAAFLLYISAELILVSKRGDYNAIQWIFPCSLLLSKYRSNLLFLIILGLALLQFHFFPIWIAYQYWIAESILLLLLAFSIFHPNDNQTSIHAEANNESRKRNPV